MLNDYFFCKGLYKWILQIVPVMKRLMLLLLAFSSLVFSSCAVTEEATLILPESIPEVVVPAVSEPPPVETQPDSVEVPVGGDSGNVIETPEFVYPFIGNENAPVTVVEYGDFSDGTNSFVTISQVASIRRDYVASGKVKLVFKPFPLSGTDEAKTASEASLCMWEQGSVQFWAYHNTLFAFYLHLDAASLSNYASRVPNVDKAALAGCLESGRYASLVASVLEDGRNKGIGKVPAFVIGDSVLEGDVSYKKLKSAIDAELGSGDGSRITGSAVFSQDFFYDVPKMVINSVKSFFRKI